jgi:hypothetical protein
MKSSSAMPKRTPLRHSDLVGSVILKTVKESMHEVIDELPDDVTWEGVLRAFYVRTLADAGLDPALAERASDSEIEKWFRSGEFRAVEAGTA